MSALPGLLADLWRWLPEIAGATGAGGALLGLVPGLRRYAAIALAGLLALSVTGLLWYRSQYEAEVAGRLADRAAAQQALIEQRDRDARLSAQLIAHQAAALAALRQEAGTLVRKIDNAPQTHQCGPVMRDASRGLYELFGGGAGGPPARRQPAAGVPGPGAGR